MVLRQPAEEAMSNEKRKDEGDDSAGPQFSVEGNPRDHFDGVRQPASGERPCGFDGSSEREENEQ